MGHLYVAGCLGDGCSFLGGASRMQHVALECFAEVASTGCMHVYVAGDLATELCRCSGLTASSPKQYPQSSEECLASAAPSAAQWGLSHASRVSCTRSQQVSRFSTLPNSSLWLMQHVASVCHAVVLGGWSWLIWAPIASSLVDRLGWVYLGRVTTHYTPSGL
jgi:hypothetical protein